VSTLADVRWHWTVEAYEKAAAAGVFGPEPRVELFEGEVLAVPSMLPGHAEAVRVLHAFASRISPTNRTVGSQEPVLLSDDSEPEPDLWIARGGPGTYGARHPTVQELVLVVEVSDTTLAMDRNVKMPGYAAAGVPEAWLVSLPERTVTVFRHPLGRRWSETAALRPGDELVHRDTGLTVSVRALFAHLET
jgi:Uma2 family endonuclease